jgi:predicted RecA/RadA family phage recombinase
MAVTADQPIKVQSPGKLVAYPAVASVAHYGGTLAFIIAASGYATNVIAAGANIFAGIVKSNGGVAAPAASGDANVECWTEGDFELLTASADQGWVGDLIYAVDNYMVDKTSASQTLVGRCVGFVSATRIIVRIQVNAT